MEEMQIVLVISLVISLYLGFMWKRERDAVIKVKDTITPELEALKADKLSSEKNLSELKEELKSAREKLEAKLEQTARLEAEKKGLDEKILQHRQDIEEMKKEFHLQFENLANRIFEEKTSKFKKDSEEGLGQLLNPLRERLQEFQKKVDESFGQQAKEQFSLKEEINRIVLANEKITVQAENLTNALKGESKTQGNWGEVILEKILEDSGLQKNVTYRVQADLQNTEGERLRPDVIVMLPEDKHIIVDSKVSLTHYEQYFSESDDTKRAALLKQFLSSVRSHVVGLEQRKYQDTEKLNTPDFVLMFIPIEGAYALAVQQDTALHSYAWDKRVAIVCPSTLFISLKTIANLWRIETQNRNTLEIARQGGGLYDKVVGFVEEMERLGERIDKTKEVYDKACNQLWRGKGDIVSRTEKLKALGVKATKKMPSKLLDDADVTKAEEAGEEKVVALLEREGA